MRTSSETKLVFLLGLALHFTTPTPGRNLVFLSTEEHLCP